MGFLLIFLLIWGGIIYACAKVAEGKGRSAVNWGMLGAVFGLVALLIVAVIGPGEEAATSVASPSNYRRCPYCAEMVRREAVVCRYCHRELEPVPAYVPSASPAIAISQVTAKCSECGASNRVDARSCKKCGVSFLDEPAQA